MSSSVSSTPGVSPSSERPGAGTTVTRPAWITPLSLALCLIGLAISAYLTYEHYTGSTTLACSATGAIDCHKVTTSTYATLFGAPVALLGLLFYVVMTLLCLPMMWRRTGAVEYVRWAGLAGGLAMVLYLIYAEFQLHAICLWCSGVHATTIVLVLATMVAEGSTLRTRRV